MEVDPHHWPLVVEYWEKVEDCALPVPKCTNCDEMFFPPRVVCPYCLSGDVELFDSEGTGKLYSYSVVHVDYHPDWGSKAPYVNALVDLDDGPVVFGNVVDYDSEELEVGRPVEVRFDRPVDEQLMPLFTPI